MAEVPGQYVIELKSLCIQSYTHTNYQCRNNILIGARSFIEVFFVGCTLHTIYIPSKSEVMPIYLRRLLVVFLYCRSLSKNHYSLLLIVDIFDDVCNEVFCIVIVMYSLCIRIVFVLLIFTLMIFFSGKENY